MAVKFTKPEINVREKLAELDKPSGIAGEAMLRAETPQEQFNLIGAGRRNLIINGENKISQRGTYTSATAVTESYYIDSSAVSFVNRTVVHSLPYGTPRASVWSDMARVNLQIFVLHVLPEIVALHELFPDKIEEEELVLPGAQAGSEAAIEGAASAAT